MLFLMHGFDVCRAAFRQHIELTGWTKIAASLSDALQPGAWLKISWFLDVPLAVNALILCPMVICRAVKSGEESKKTAPALIAAAGMMMFALIYLLFVFY